jgi:hypothetical protein
VVFERPPALAAHASIANRKSKMRNVVLLGSTGSIGTSTVKVAEDLPERFRLIGLAAGNNVELLREQVRKHRPAAISISDPAKARELANEFNGTPVHAGNEHYPRRTSSSSPLSARQVCSRRWRRFARARTSPWLQKKSS